MTESTADIQRSSTAASRLAAGPVNVSRRTALSLWLAPAILVVPMVKTAERVIKALRGGVAA